MRAAAQDAVAPEGVLVLTTRVRRILVFEWDVVAGAIAAVVAIFLSHFGVVSQVSVSGIVLLLSALLLIHMMRVEAHVHVVAENLGGVRQHVLDIEGKVGGTDVVVIPPLRIRQEFREFASRVQGELVWYNACCRMFRRQAVFDVTLRQLIDNPDVTAIRMVCAPREQAAWEADVVVKLRRCGGDAKVPVPVWGPLPPATSFLIGELRAERMPQALLVIMEEPFAAMSNGLGVPRYMFRVQNHSQLLPRMDEAARAAMGSFAAGGQPEQAGERRAVDAAAVDPE